MRMATLAAAIYLVGAFLTGGNYANHRCEPYQKYYDACGFGAVVGGAFWPVYWAGRGALVVTR